MNGDGEVRIALDAHGGDHGPELMVRAAEHALGLDEHLAIDLVGLADELEPRLAAVAPAVRGRLRLAPADEALPADARPLAALRRGTGSSLGAAIGRVASGESHACVSAGSTAAILALAVKHVGLVEGIERPALMGRIPARDDHTNLLDLGANLNVTAEQLVQFAQMGSVALRAEGGPMPRVGLLNVGHEDSKGHDVVKEAHERLRALDMGYVGFVEGHDLFAGKVDVAVCDGFAGNLMLKSGEGLARMLLGEVRAALESSWRSRLGGWLAAPALRTLVERFHPAKHNGAPFLGVDGVVVKSHGAAGLEATVSAIAEAAREHRRDVPRRIADRIRRTTTTGESAQ